MKNMYSSMECKCAECGKDFLIPNYKKQYIYKDVDYKKSHEHKVYFCSRKCMKKWRTKNK